MTGFGEALIVNCRLAPAVMDVVCVMLLSASPGVVVVATAVLVNVFPPAAVTINEMSTNLSVLDGTVPKLQTTFGAE